MSITPIYGWDDSRVGYPPEPVELQGVGFWPRAFARVIDLVVHSAIAFLTGLLFGLMLRAASGGHVPPPILAKLRHGVIARFIFALLGSAAFQVILTTVHGSSLGKLALSMVVVQEDGSPCRFKGALIRELGYFVDALFFGLVGYMEMTPPQEQRFGDEWAHTMVCKRSAVAPDTLRNAERFAAAFFFALAVDAAFIMTGMLLRIAV